MGWLRSGERPSMVVIFLPATAEMGVTQDRTGWPSMWTVQAPHNDMPHPNLVPVMPSVSRKTQSSGMAEGFVSGHGLQPCHNTSVANGFSRCGFPAGAGAEAQTFPDRKSTRLNSSHLG